jgi:hypothetical protein
MKEERNIPLKNYIILSIILLISIIVVIYFYMWYGEFYSNKNNTPIMNNYFNVINYNELDTYLVENNYVVIYASVLQDEKIRSFEKKFRKIVEEYSLNNRIIYLDLTEQYNDKKLYESILNKYNFLNMPCIIIFKDGIINDIYSISDRNYDINLLLNYLRIKGVIYD